MSRLIWTGLVMLLGGVVIVGLVGARHAEPEGDSVVRILEKMKTVCVGRISLDMPEDAQVELTQARIDGFNIRTFDETLDEFESRVAQREAEIAAKADRLGGKRNVEMARDLKTDNGVTGKMFVHSRVVTEGTRAKGLELERYRYEEVTVEALVHSNGISIDFLSEGHDPAWIKDLPLLVNKLVVNPANRIPAEPGFCIDRAYFQDPLTADQGEHIMMLARLPSHPDVDFMLILSAGLKPDEQGLLARSEAADGRLSVTERMRISKLRAAPRQIDGLPGEELVELFVEENDARVHSFWWEVNGTEDNVLIPHLVFKMNTGSSTNGPVSSSLSDGTALGLWDKITSSIHLRNVTAQRASKMSTASVPIGTYASAGEQCPESGWWLCGDGGNGIGVLGGQRQYIKKGEPMPQALLLPPPTLWDRVRGLQPSFESKNRTTWKLVDHRARKRLPPPLPLAKASAPSGATVAVGVSEQLDGGRVAIGSFSSTGVPCPASGWWRCEESHALDGTRWFAQGSLLPPATFTVGGGGDKKQCVCSTTGVKDDHRKWQS